MKAKSASRSAGISAVAYALPKQSNTLPELAAQGLIRSAPDQLSQLGFGRVYVAGTESGYQLACRAVAKLLRLTGAAPQDVDAIVYASALPVETLRPRKADPLRLFQYPATALQYEFRFTRANVIGLAQAGCVSFLSAIRIASNLISAEPQMQKILCVGADVLPRGSSREILYNVISDGAAAALIERQSDTNRILAHAQVTKGYFWDSTGKSDQIVATYFATARHVIQETLDRARLRISDIAMILPHNVNRPSWDVLRELFAVPTSRFYGTNIARKGHTIAADNMINLSDAMKAGRNQKGDRLLLFTFGFGAHWACTILEH